MYLQNETWFYHSHIVYRDKLDGKYYKGIYMYLQIETWFYYSHIVYRDK